MKKLVIFNLFFCLFLNILCAQDNAIIQLVESDNHKYSNIEYLNDELYIIANQSEGYDPQLLKLTESGLSLIKQYNEFQGYEVASLLSIFEIDDATIGLALVVKDSQTYVALLHFDATFEITDLSSMIPVPNLSIQFESHHKRWNQMEQRYEWLLGLNDGESILFRELLNLYIDENNLLVHRHVIIPTETDILYGWAINKSTGQYIFSSRYAFTLNNSFEVDKIYPTEIFNGEVTKVHHTDIYTSFDGNQVDFYSRKLTFDFNISKLSGEILGDSLHITIEDIDILENDAQVYALFLENDDRTSFLTWSENILLPPVNDDLKAVSFIHFDTNFHYKGRVRLNLPGAITDVLYKNNTYYGCGTIFNHPFELDNFYFIIPEDSEFVTGTGDVEISMPNIIIYPNPTSSELHISGETESLKQYSISTIDGKMIQSFTPFVPDISLDLPKGIYIITFSGKSGIFTSHRVIVK